MNYSPRIICSLITTFNPVTFHSEFHKCSMKGPTVNIFCLVGHTFHCNYFSLSCGMKVIISNENRMHAWVQIKLIYIKGTSARHGLQVKFSNLCLSANRILEKVFCQTSCRSVRFCVNFTIQLQMSLFIYKIIQYLIVILVHHCNEYLWSW